MSDFISKRELYHKLGEAYNKGYLSWGANEIFKDIIGECDSVENKGDLISRQAVDDVIYDYSRSCDVNYAQIMEYINKIPSVENKGEWIPVTERLPEEEHEVYCQLSDGSNAVLYVQDNWGQMEWVDGMMGTGTYDVVAWMKKPEPYKAEKPETCKGCLEPCIMYEPDMRGCKKKVREVSE